MKLVGRQHHRVGFMSDYQISLHFQVIRQRIGAMQRGEGGSWEEIDAVLEDLQVIYEQMQTSLEIAGVIQEDLLEQNQQLGQQYYHYYELFQSLSVAYLVIDTDGVILEANEAIAQLLKVPQCYLAGKPLVLYVAEGERSAFRLNLNRLAQRPDVQVWQMALRPREGIPFVTQWHVAVSRNTSGQIERLGIGVYNLSQSQQDIAHLIGQQPLRKVRVEGEITISKLPPSLDGLRVLVVDDEADIREFITAVLESYGISVRAVASTAAALEALKQFGPDVLVSDIRMPGGSGYDLIRQIRDLEASQGGHLPAAAITAYQDEDREKSLNAGYEAHLHKFAQPSEWVEMVAQLARQASRPEHHSLD